MRQTTSAEIAIWPGGRMPARATEELTARAIADWDDLAAACAGDDRLESVERSTSHAAASSGASENQPLAISSIPKMSY